MGFILRHFPSTTPHITDVIIDNGLFQIVMDIGYLKPRPGFRVLELLWRNGLRLVDKAFLHFFAKVLPKSCQSLAIFDDFSKRNSQKVL